MKIITKPETQLKGQNIIAAIGAFDGVHLGHQELFKTAFEVRERTGCPVVSVSFDPHPKQLLMPSAGYNKLLTPEAEKTALFEYMGVDYFWPIPFTPRLLSMAPEEFINRYLQSSVKTQYLVCGFDFTFGFKGQGTSEYLKEVGKNVGFEVSVLPPFTIGQEPVSSTGIRRFLMEGRVEVASSYLGRPYCIYGEVVSGKGVGRKMNAPTANIRFPSDKLLPRNGVYAVFAKYQGQDLSPAVANVGVRPTFNGIDTTVEVHIPEFEGRLYGRGMQVFFMKHIREERRFKNKEALKAQISEDIQESMLALNRSNWPSEQRSFTLARAYDKILHAN